MPYTCQGKRVKRSLKGAAGLFLKGWAPLSPDNFFQPVVFGHAAINPIIGLYSKIGYPKERITTRNSDLALALKDCLLDKGGLFIPLLGEGAEIGQIYGRAPERQACNCQYDEKQARYQPLGKGCVFQTCQPSCLPQACP